MVPEIKEVLKMGVVERQYLKIQAGAVLLIIMILIGF